MAAMGDAAVAAGVDSAMPYLNPAGVAGASKGEKQRVLHEIEKEHQQPDEKPAAKPAPSAPGPGTNATPK